MARSKIQVLSVDSDFFGVAIRSHLLSRSSANNITEAPSHVASMRCESGWTSGQSLNTAPASRCTSSVRPSRMRTPSIGNKPFRSLGFAFFVVTTAVLIPHGKTYYPLPVYPIVIAAGAIGLESLLWNPRYRRMAMAYVALVVVTGALMLPYGVPVLPVDTLLAYQDVVPLTRIVKMERDSAADLHQLYADMFGWENIAQTVGTVYQSV